jgi:predicted transcriptional regulator
MRKQVLLSAAIIAKIDAIAKKRKQSFSAVLEDACCSFT